MKIVTLADYFRNRAEIERALRHLHLWPDADDIQAVGMAHLSRWARPVAMSFQAARTAGRVGDRSHRASVALSVALTRLEPDRAPNIAPPQPLRIAEELSTTTPLWSSGRRDAKCRAQAEVRLAASVCKTISFIGISTMCR